MTGSIGKPIRRLEGRVKVLGKARFSADYPVRGVVHAVLVLSTIAKGRVTGFDLRAAQAAPGVLRVLTHLNAPKLLKKGLSSTLMISSIPAVGENWLPLQDDRVLHDRQIVAVVVAETLERAEQAAALVRVSYAPEQAATDFQVGKARAFAFESRIDADYQRGDPDAGLSRSAARIDARYSIPTQHHNPIETHATIAVWSGDKLTLYDKTQSPVVARSQAAVAFGLPVTSVRVLSAFVGGGFGGSGRTWPHVLSAAMAARVVGRPVKLSLSREQMYGSTGSRPLAEQRLRLGADADGRLRSIIHEVTAQTSTYEEYTEEILDASRILYACANVRTKYRLVSQNIPTPTFMRGPGHSSGVFALESALDELAVQLRLDPVELRLRNYAEQDQAAQLPWSSKSLRQCYEQAGQKFGWSHRTPVTGSMKDGRLLVGQGMASAIYPAGRLPASARVRLLANGTAVVYSSTSDMGPGSYTSMSQVAADALGLPIERVRTELGDTDFPYGPAQAGSWMMATLGPAVQAAAQEARRKAVALAVADRRSPLYRADPAGVRGQNGQLSLTSDPTRTESYASLLTRRGVASVEGHQTTSPGSEQEKYSFWIFGAHFVEVTVDPDLLEVRVRRVVSASGVGRIVNPHLADSQARGGLAWGLGQALMEQTHRDRRTGRVTNANLSEYLVPVNADVPVLEPIYVEENEPYLNPLGVKGLGQISIVGMSAAVANAVHHATGVRVRDLPITLEKLLAGMPG